MAPEYQQPSAPVPESFPLAEEAAGAAAATIAWQEYFADEQLQALIAQTLEHNRDLRAAYGITRAGLYPQVDAIVSYNRSRTPADLSFTGRPLIAEDYLIGLGVNNWEIDFWGRIRSLKDAALQSFLASDEARRALNISLIAQVADSYMILRELDERIAIARKIIASRAESLRIFKLRFEVGATSKLDLIQGAVFLFAGEVPQDH